jgi:hypothetical protein
LHTIAMRRGNTTCAAGQPVNTFLVPDISGGERTSQAVLKAAQAAAEAMSTGELLARAAAEIGGTWFLAWVLKTTCARLGDAALQACTSLPPLCYHARQQRAFVQPSMQPCKRSKNADAGAPCYAARRTLRRACGTWMTRTASPTRRCLGDCISAFPIAVVYGKSWQPMH